MSLISPNQQRTYDQLQRDLDAMFDPIDVPGDWSQRKKNDHEDRRRLLTHQDASVRRALATLGEVQPDITRLANEDDLLTGLRTKYQDTLDGLRYRQTAVGVPKIMKALGESVAIINGSIGDLRSVAVSEHLPLIDDLREQGYPSTMADPLAGMFGHLDSIRERLKHLMARRDAARKDLDSVLGVAAREDDNVTADAPAPA